MKEISLTNGGVVRVDDADYEALSAHKWQRHQRGYAYRFERRRPAKGVSILMHREILRPAAGLHVDHIDGDVTNNTRANLRECNASQNLANRAKQTNGTASAYKGVSRSSVGRWRARVCRVTVGYFNTEAEAAMAHNDAAVAKYGEFAVLNVIQAVNNRIAA